MERFKQILSLLIINLARISCVHLLIKNEIQLLIHTVQAQIICRFFLCMGQRLTTILAVSDDGRR